MKLNTTTETVQVGKHNFELTDAELYAALADPAAFVKALKKRKAARKAPKRAAAPNGRRPLAVEMATCPQCGKTLAAKYLDLHLKRKHAPATPIATAPAAE